MHADAALGCPAAAAAAACTPVYVVHLQPALLYIHTGTEPRLVKEVRVEALDRQGPVAARHVPGLPVPQVGLPPAAAPHEVALKLLNRRTEGNTERERRRGESVAKFPCMCQGDCSVLDCLCMQTGCVGGWSAFRVCVCVCMCCCSACFVLFVCRLACRQGGLHA